MPRLRNAVSGVVVNVDDALAARLGAGYSPVEAEKKQPARKAPAKKSTK